MNLGPPHVVSISHCITIWLPTVDIFFFKSATGYGLWDEVLVGILFDAGELGCTKKLTRGWAYVGRT